MEIVSSGQSTILSTYPQFETKCVYQHSQKEILNDFQFFSKKHLFITVNKKNGLEFLRINNPSQIESKTSIISRVRKIHVDKLYCVACPKQSYDEVALGLTNGEVRMLHYKTNSYTAKFSDKNSRNSVLCLSFNASDEYLSSVYENGIVNIYGIKTKTKLETLNMDSNMTLCRFHPTKKFHLSLASFNGSVYVYDIQSKRKIFRSVESHTAPCREIFMSFNQPDILLSAGYDCLINIYDIRKKSQLQKIKCEHPLSTGAVSDCGYFCCVGNLKGELISYDLRSTKTYLACTKLYKTAVTRVAFVPKEFEKQSNTLEATALNSNVDQPNEIKNLQKNDTAEQTRPRDSFCDFLSFHVDKSKDEKFKSRLTLRESFDWSIFNRNKLCSSNSSSKENVSPQLLEETDQESPLNNEQKVNSKKYHSSDTSQNRLISAKEKKSIDKNPGKSNNLDESLNCPEKNQLSCKKDEMINHLEKNMEKLQSNEAPQENVANFNFQCEILKQLQAFKMKFEELESNIKFNAESNKWEIFNQNSKLWMKQQHFNNEMRDSIEHLLRTDEFLQEFVRLKEENEELKLEILQLRRKNDNNFCKNTVKNL